MSRTRTIDPSLLARITTLPNSSGLTNLPLVITGRVSWVVSGDGSRPSRPAGLVVFCSCTAAETSCTVSPIWAIRSGSRLSSIEKSS